MLSPAEGRKLSKMPKNMVFCNFLKNASLDFLIFCTILEANETFNLTHSLTHRKIWLLSYGVPKMSKIAKISIFGASVQFGSSDFFYFLYKSKSVCVKLINAKKLNVTFFALPRRGSKIVKNAQKYDFLQFSQKRFIRFFWFFAQY